MSTHSSRLQRILAELKITPFQFAKELGYKRPDSVYQILNGESRITTQFVERLKNTDYKINTNWLLLGEGIPIAARIEKGEYGNEIGVEGQIFYPARLNFNHVRKLARFVSKAVFSYEEEQDYMVKARSFSIEGLEIVYTTLHFENGRQYPEKMYVVTIQPDWRVSSFFDFWRIEEESKRCQNLIDMSKDLRQQYLESFEMQIAMLINDIDRNENLRDMIPFTEEGGQDKNGYIEIYSTDIRK